jgi:PTS system nitrogen regulatory IIA component
MQLTIRDVSELLNISERTIYRWIKQKTIPAYKIHDQYRFNKAELMEWAAANKISVSPEIFHEPESPTGSVPSLAEALKAGGIHYRVEGKDKEAVIRASVESIKLPEDVDKDFLIKVLLAREELGSTGVGDGIAIPHVRNPIVLNVSHCLVGLSFLEKPVDFGAIDGKPVHCLFMLVSPTARVHLYLLSRLAFALRDAAFNKAILEHDTRDAIFRELERVEKSVKGPADPHVPIRD